MPIYLHVKVHDAAAHGDYDPAARQAAEESERELRTITVAQLLTLGCGWLSKEPLSRQAIANEYDSYRSEIITAEQVAEWRKARAAAEREL